MKKTLIILLPIVLLIVSIVSSFIAFDYSNQLEDGYIYVDNEVKTPNFSGEYSAIIGNIEEGIHSISIEPVSNGINIYLYDTEQTLIKSYILVVKDMSLPYTDNIIVETLEIDFTAIDNLEDYIVTVELEKGKTYEISLTETLNIGEDQEIDLVFFNLPLEVYNNKNLFENVSFTTLIFFFISLVTIFGVRYSRKDR